MLGTIKLMNVESSEECWEQSLMDAKNKCWFSSLNITRVPYCLWWFSYTEVRTKRELEFGMMDSRWLLTVLLLSPSTIDSLHWVNTSHLNMSRISIDLIKSMQISKVSLLSVKWFGILLLLVIIIVNFHNLEITCDQIIILVTSMSKTFLKCFDLGKFKEQRTSSIVNFYLFYTKVS